MTNGHNQDEPGLNRVVSRNACDGPAAMQKADDLSFLAAAKCVQLVFGILSLRWSIRFSW
jgi:hypothetical protein